MLGLRKFMTTTLILLVLILLSAPIYIRMAPVEPTVYHRTSTPRPPGDYPVPGGFEAVRVAASGDLARLDQIIRATPRTKALGGALAEGHVSYVTRSLIWGFPDVTNVWSREGKLHIRGHLVYGRSDFGVNQARIEGWLQALGQP